jgi:hypothetical protein
MERRGAGLEARASLCFTAASRRSGQSSREAPAPPVISAPIIPGVEKSAGSASRSGSMSDQSGGYSLERNTSRALTHLRSSRAMVIKLILAEEISENPCCSGNREGLGVFAPIRMIVGIRKNQRYPHE